MAIGEATVGTTSKVWYVATTGNTDADVLEAGSAVGGIQSISWDLSNNMLDSTNNDDAGFTSAVYGNQSCSLTLDCVFDLTDTAQLALITAATAKTKVGIGYHPTAANGEKMFLFDALVESSGISGGNDEIVTISFTLTSTGTIRTDAPTA